MTSRPLAFPDSAEVGRQAMLDAEAALHTRMMADPRYAARQPTSAERDELAAMDAAEAQARAAWYAAEAAVVAHSRSAPEGARLAGPAFAVRELDAQFVDQLGRNTVAHEAKYQVLMDRRLKLQDEEADIRTLNNQRRAVISRAQSRRG